MLGTTLQITPFCFFVFVFVFCVPGACGSSPARDQTQVRAATLAAAVTTPNLLLHNGIPPPSRWPELSLGMASSCKGGWEIKYQASQLLCRKWTRTSGLGMASVQQQVSPSPFNLSGSFHLASFNSFLPTLYSL